MSELLPHWHELAYAILAIVFIAIYILHFMPGMKDSKLKSLIQAESILLVVLVFVGIIAVRVETVVTHIEEIADRVNQSLDDFLAGADIARVERLDNLEESYLFKNRALQETKNEVRIYRFREETGTDLMTFSEQAKLWYGQLETWVTGQPGRAVYTVVGTPTPKMEQWFIEECAESVGQGNRLVKNLEEELRAPRMNFVVFDRREVILVAHTASGLVGVTNAYRVEDEGFATFFARFHRELMTGAESCPN